jgi:hypothetical protein
MGCSVGYGEHDGDTGPSHDMAAHTIAESCSRRRCILSVK